MNLLGLDLASRLTGWCAGDGARLPDCGAWAFEPCEGDYGYLLDQLDRHLAVCIDRFRPEACAYEAPILVARGRGGSYGDSLAKLRLLYPLGAHVEFVCRRRGIQCFEVSVRAIKKEVTGNHLAEKGDLVAVAEKVGLKLPATKTGGKEDAADAWGAWLLLLRHMAPELSRGWDKAIWSPRNAMLGL